MREHMSNRILGILMLGIACVMVWTACGDDDKSGEREWELTWEDDFEGAAGSLPDATKWNFDVGTDWGNQQLEYDTDRAENASLDGNGHLAIVAREENFAGSRYTSARLTTAGKFEQQYGRFEARMKLPWGQGLWPAFWMLGNDFSSAGWPQCGEIDIMEYRGQEPTVVHGSLHGPGYFAGSPVTDKFTLIDSRFDTDFHIFRVDWGADYIDFYVDDVIYNRVSAEDVPGEWVFDHPFFLIVNLAVGGNYLGPPNADTQFPQTLLIDYVRVYKEK